VRVIQPEGRARGEEARAAPEACHEALSKKRKREARRRIRPLLGTSNCNHLLQQRI
jgi:hypothetical protein